jgi:hypothetical protein
MTVVKSPVRVAPSHRKSEYHAKDVMPKAILEFSKTLPELIDAYFRWADEEGGYLHESQHLLGNLTSQTSSDGAFAVIKQAILRQFPMNTKTELKRLVTFAKDFYSQRGTPDSYKFLFKSLFDTTVAIGYPGDYVFKTSDGSWVQNTMIKLLFVDGILDYRGLRFVGLTSGASALVSEITVHAEGRELLAHAAIIDINGEFIVDELVESISPTAGRIVTRAIGSVGSVTIDEPGRGYKDDVYIPLLSSGDGSGFSAKIRAVDDTGKILAVDISAPGSNFIYEPPVLNMDHPNIIANVNDYVQAKVSLDIVANYVEVGRYKSGSSAPSSIYSVLHDGSYYQNYSYTLKTNIPLSMFEGPVKDLLHPAGTRMFAQTSLDTSAGDFDNLDGAIVYRNHHPEDAAYNNEYSGSTRKFLDYTLASRSTAGTYIRSFVNSYWLFIDTYILTNETLFDSYAQILIDGIVDISVEGLTDHSHNRGPRYINYVYEYLDTMLDDIDDDVLGIGPVYGLTAATPYNHNTLQLMSVINSLTPTIKYNSVKY